MAFNSSTHLSKRSTCVDVVVGIAAFVAPAGDASSEPISKSSFWMMESFSRRGSRELSVHNVTQRPRWLLSSSMSPYAETRMAFFLIREPPTSPVVPSSPVLV